MPRRRTVLAEFSPCLNLTSVNLAKDPIVRLQELRCFISLSSPTVCGPPSTASSAETLAADNIERNRVEGTVTGQKHSKQSQTKTWFWNLRLAISIISEKFRKQPQFPESKFLWPLWYDSWFSVFSYLSWYIFSLLQSFYLYLSFHPFSGLMLFPNYFISL